MWYGIKIKDKIELKSISIIVGEESLIILAKNLKEAFNFLEFFVIIKHYLKKDYAKLSFGIFLDLYLRVKRQRIKKDLIRGFDEETLVYLLDYQNTEAYYTHQIASEEFLGIDIRFSKKTSEWFNREEEIEGLMKEIKEEKKKIFEK